MTLLAAMQQARPHRSSTLASSVTGQPQQQDIILLVYLPFFHVKFCSSSSLLRLCSAVLEQHTARFMVCVFTFASHCVVMC